jgi:hypothetical protein
MSNTFNTKLNIFVHIICKIIDNWIELCIESKTGSYALFANQTHKSYILITFGINSE